jgi:uncharacterized protein (DUF2147 family)
MIYAYRLKNKAEKTGRVVEGFTIRQTWQFTSDDKAAVLKKWPTVAVIEAKDIKEAKAAVDEYEKSDKPDGEAETGIPDGTSVDPENPLVKELAGKNLSELKDFAKANGFEEAEYSRLTRSKLIEYIVLGMSSKG